MPTYVAFLRAINLGAKRKFPRDAIRSVAEDAGFTEVETYINTGNLRVATGMRSRAKVELALERAFLADRGFEVPTIAFSPAELREIAAAAEATVDHDGRHYVSLLKDPPGAEAAQRMEAPGGDREVAQVVGRAVHLLLATPTTRPA